MWLRYDREGTLLPLEFFQLDDFFSRYIGPRVGGLPFYYTFFLAYKSLFFHLLCTSKFFPIYRFSIN